jgi:hypothetical protein
MPRNPTLTVKIDGDESGLNKSLGAAEKKVGRFSGGAIAKVAKIAVPAAAVAGVLLKLAKAADKGATATASLNQTLENQGIAAAGAKPAIDAAIANSKALAFSSTETKNALAPLVTATGDVAVASELLAVAQDVARASGTDLTTAADAVAKAYVGQDKALRGLMPGITAGATGMETIANASAAAAGQADIFADSAQGMGIKAVAAFKGLAAQIGGVFVPVLKALLPLITQLISLLSTLITAILPVITPLIKALTGAINTATAAISKIVTWVQKLIDKIKQLMGPLNDAVSKIKQLNPFSKGAMGQTYTVETVATQMGVGTTTQSQGRGGGGVTINIYGDPSVIEARVTKALRDYTRRNGAGSVFTPERS